MERDLPALWRSPGWRAEIEGWLGPALEEAGVRVTGPLVQERVRFWSTVLHVETDAGRVWVKENAPSQAFEARLVAAVAPLVPGFGPPLLAVEPDRGWFATADLGLPMWHDEDPPPVPDWVSVLEGYAVGQRSLAAHGTALLATGLPEFPAGPDAVVGWVEEVLGDLRALPCDDPRRPTDDDVDAVTAGLPRVRAAAAELAASDGPASLQHNDLHLANAFRLPTGGAAFIDLGDALWTHPLTAARIPLWIMRGRFSLGADDPDIVRARDAFLEAWTDVADRATLAALLPAADRLSCLHRAESWRRLQADVPVSAVDEPLHRSVVSWLLVAAAEDPFETAMAD